MATHGTADYIGARAIPIKPVLKVSEGRPNVVDDIKNGTISLIINTPLGHRARQDEYAIGWAAIKYKSRSSRRSPQPRPSCGGCGPPRGARTSTTACRSFTSSYDRATARMRAGAYRPSAVAPLRGVP